MVGWEIPASLQTHDSYLLNHTNAHTHANRCPISCSCNKPSPHLAAGHKRPSCAPNDTLASCTPPNAHILNPHTQGNGPARIRPLLPSHYHPLPSLIGPATAAALTNTRAHAHLYHHLHSRFAYPSQGHPPRRHMCTSSHHYWDCRLVRQHPHQLLLLRRVSTATLER